VSPASISGSRQVDVARVEVVAPNLKRRLSGVTSSIIQLIPVQAETLGIATLGPGLPEFLPRMKWWQVPWLLRQPRSKRARIWHARRNVEMIAGLVLRHVFRAPLRLVFTSAAQRAHKPFTRWLIRRMDAVIATSARSGGFLEVPHTIVRHGIDLTKFRPRQAGEASESGPVHLVGCFGRIRHQKGTDLFVAAMIDLLPGFPNWSAVISGRVTVENQAFARDLQARIDAAGLTERIRFLGEVPDIAVWYRKIDLYVAPSRNEGFGLTPLEAMASGTAVVASDAGAYAEMVEPGETGAVVPAGDGETLRAAIEPYLRSPETAAAHGRNGLALVRERFPLQREADGIRRVYEAVWNAG
jgi:mannosyltransferase